MTLIEVEREAAGPSPPTAAERPVEAKRFNAWTNLVITPAVELVVIALPLVAVLFLRRFRGLGFGSSVLVFYLCMVGWTFLVMRLIRAFFPIRPAVLTPSRTPRAFYVWTLWSFLATTNLHMLYVRSILSVNFRKTFYRLLGAHLGKGIMVLGGTIFDPYLVTIEEGVMLGWDSILTPHFFARDVEDTVVLGRIHIKKGVVVGVKATIGPGVTIGEYSVINALSGVKPFTTIPPYEVWEGLPAKKVGDVPRDNRQ